MLSPIEYGRIALLRPELRAVALPLIADFEAATGKDVRILPRGAVRSYADQVELWNARASNPYPVAQPGTSRHEMGAALDLSIAGGGTRDDYDLLGVLAEKYFLDWGGYFPTYDGPHVQLRETPQQSAAAWAAMQSERKLYLVGGLALLAFLLFTTNHGD